MHNVFFVDDNLIGIGTVAKLLLCYLAAYQYRHGYASRFDTKVSLNLAQGQELLARTRVCVTMVVEQIESRPLRELARVLQRIGCHGDRVFVEVSERLRDVVAVDSSIFKLVLRSPPPR